MDYVIIHQETGLVICKECKFALIPSRINSHFSGSPHRITPKIRHQIENDISNIDNLVTQEDQIEIRIEQFLSSFDHSHSIPELAIYSNGLACPHCFYVSRSITPIKKHLKDIHNWENPQKNGQRKKKSDKDPWKSNTLCQQFFQFSPGNQYFRVNSIRASPKEVSIRPRVERSRESSSNVSQDLDLSRSIPQGIYRLFYPFLPLYHSNILII